MYQIKTTRKIPMVLTFVFMSLAFGYFQNCSEVSFSEKMENSKVEDAGPTDSLDLGNEDGNPLPTIPESTTEIAENNEIETTPPTETPNPGETSPPESSEETSETNPGETPGETNSGENDNSVVNNPFEDTPSVPVVPGGGLMGNLYYLTESHADIFRGNLYNAKLDDYRIYGVSVPVNIVMTSINIEPRPWTSGFSSENGALIKKENGEALFEWFHLDLSGYISLPAGTYQFAMISDDGMRVTIDGSIYLDHDSIHAPEWRCASRTVSFDGTTKRRIRVQYHQGPREEIAMQLLIRTEDKINSSCRSNAGFERLPEGSLTH